MWSQGTSEKNKSEKSTVFQSLNDKRYSVYIEQLRRQNQYKKKALETAENLINTYQKQNLELKKQNARLEQIIQSKKNEVKIMREMFVENVGCRVSVPQINDSQQKNKVNELSLQINSLLENKKYLEQKILKIQQKLARMSQKSFLQKQTSNYNQFKTIQSEKIYSQEKIKENKMKNNKIYKQKNITELRALHLKLRMKQSQFDSQQKNKKLCELVTKIFSTDKRYQTPDRHSHKSIKQRNQTVFSEKKKYALTDMKQISAKKGHKKHQKYQK